MERIAVKYVQAGGVFAGCCRLARVEEARRERLAPRIQFVAHGIFLMIFVAIIVITGLVTRQSQRYWAHALFAVVMQVIAGFLLYGGGTLDDPTGDGLITAWLRQQTNDGLEVALLVIPAVALGWVIPTGLVMRGYERRGKEGRSSLPEPEGAGETR